MRTKSPTVEVTREEFERTLRKYMHRKLINGFIYAGDTAIGKRVEADDGPHFFLCKPEVKKS